ncbi:phosphate ABC transporter permease PstA [Oxynema aestuarii]|jgi:phosphate transport system permease protein|uniref:Phosphate ABC transporter permease PstA n=1 Tax=Oxynema aestuarii AP17 TaxID=2064643 RepID=A0A6H1TRT7_9CYAN|nr:phosphate ABC transporter permease PstA [Oxynema aestuarii]QIZ69318.1 phosphate ABC transporter permease PstA [Oxynema aestuarii AP17]
MEFDPSSLPEESRPSWRGNLQSSQKIEAIVRVVLSVVAAIPIAILVAIVAILLYETTLFFQEISPWRFFTDTEWTPLFPSRQVGIVAIASATLLVSGIALLVAIPIGLPIAIYLAEYANDRLRFAIKPILEALSGIPTVVYGYFALLVVTPLLQRAIPQLSAFSALSAGIVTGITVVPIVSSLSEDAIRSVPQSLREGGYALGLTKIEAIWTIVLPVAFPGIMASFTLAASRVLGETTIAAIAAGQTPQLTLNPLVPVLTMTSFIIQVSLGTVSFDSLAFHTIFTVGMVLFLLTLSLNSFGHWLVRRHQQRMSEGVVPSDGIVQSFPKLPEPSSDRQADEDVGGSTLTRLSVGGAPLFLSSSPHATRRVDDWFPSPPVDRFRTRLSFRKGLNYLFQAISVGAIAATLLVLALLMFDALNRGLTHLNVDFLTGLPSRKPQEAGIYPALMGTLWLWGLTVVFAFPIGIGTAIFLEEYCPDNWLNQVIEINIANLSAVPSIIYGLLGLELFVRLLEPMTGGASILSAAMTLSVVILPMSIVATRAALRSVPNSLYEGGYAIGMTRTQVLWHIVLPAAFPGMVTALLLSSARAIGATSPLIAVGALPFVSFAPSLSWQGLYSRFTALPFQIFNWVSRPQQGFHDKAAAASAILVGLLLLLNVVGVYLRDRSRQKQE